jgi:hypothetical protein
MALAHTKNADILSLQTLGKCAKMMPVMVWGIIIMRKRYAAGPK